MGRRWALFAATAGAVLSVSGAATGQLPPGVTVDRARP
jgi:hypothetical protein